jgi:3-oxoacyl-[acyl-carrier protein] reductase
VALTRLHHKSPISDQSEKSANIKNVFSNLIKGISMDLGLKNKTALVAAASQGLGKATAFALAKEGVRVVICGRHKRELVKTADEIWKITQSEVIPVVADVSRLQDIKKFVNIAKKRFGTVDILVNNAGGPPTGDILAITDEQWKKGHELTLMSTIRLTREVLPMMRKQKWGRIITIVSIAAVQPLNDLLISSTIRPGLFGLSKVLSNKYSRENITFNTVCPGMILTNRLEELMIARSVEKNTSKSRYLAEAAKDIPIGRFGRPEEIGNVIAFLASEKASYITGENIVIDGGMAKGI